MYHYFTASHSFPSSSLIETIGIEGGLIGLHSSRARYSFIAFSPFATVVHWRMIESESERD